jgi:hypothetical protein
MPLKRTVDNPCEVEGRCYPTYPYTWSTVTLPKALEPCSARMALTYRERCQLSVYSLRNDTNLLHLDRNKLCEPLLQGLGLGRRRREPHRGGCERLETRLIL